jgi:hypothetical protein
VNAGFVVVVFVFVSPPPPRSRLDRRRGRRI